MKLGVSWLMNVKFKSIGLFPSNLDVDLSSSLFFCSLSLSIFLFLFSFSVLSFLPSLYIMTNKLVMFLKQIIVKSQHSIPRLGFIFVETIEMELSDKARRLFQAKVFRDDLSLHFLFVLDQNHQSVRIPTNYILILRL